MASDDSVKMDAIVVGGGPAGLTAALTMARAGLEVMLVERGEYAGAKNVGGLLYGTVLHGLMPDFHEQAPIERSVGRRALFFLGPEEHMALDFGAEAWNLPPFNHTFIVHRTAFDRWYASQAEEAGVNLIEGMVVEDLVYETSEGETRVRGVRIAGDEVFESDIVILADGANCLVTEGAREKLGLRGGRVEQDYAVGVKEILGLPKERIEDRFNLEDGEGVAIDFFGAPFEGVIGGGFLYTARESLHLGFAARIGSLTKAGLRPHDVMERLKAHPMVRRRIQGTELLEYSAHMIPEGGYHAIGELHGHGVMIAGDAAGFVNMSLYKEGTNHAMESGRLAGETAVEAHRAKDTSKAVLAAYSERLRNGVVLKDLKKYRKVPEVLERSPDLLGLYPRQVNRLLTDFFTVSERTKSRTQREAIRAFLRGLPKWRFLRDAVRARHLA